MTEVTISDEAVAVTVTEGASPGLVTAVADDLEDHEALEGTAVHGLGSAAVEDASAFEPALGNPAANGYVLSSQTDGTRAWVAQSGGGGGASDVDDLTTDTGNSGDMVRVAGAGGLEYRSAAQTLSDIGAEAAGAAAVVAGDLSDHEGDTANPHAVTAAQAEALPEDAAIVTVNATHTLLAANAGKIHECDGTFTVTLPDGLDAGYQVTLVNVGTGVITLAAATTLQSADGALTLATQYKAAVVYHRGADVWLAAGGLE